VNVNADATGTIKAAAEVAADSPDPVMSNNKSEVSTNVVTTQADIAITQGTPTYDANAKRITWTLQVTNLGPDIAERVEIKDNVAKGTTPNSVTVPAGVTYTIDGSSVIAKVASLAPGETITITIVVEIKKPVGTISNNASIKTTTYDPVTTNNTVPPSRRAP
jgi:large repetitive protein